LAFYAFSVLPVSFVGAVLLLAGIGLFVAEVFIVSHGLLGAGGLVCFVLGSVMLIDTPVPGAGIGLWLVLPTALLLGGLLSLLLTRALQARRSPHLTGLEALVGELGEVVVPLAPEGKVFVHGEYWDAVGQTAVGRGARVRVTAVEGRTLRVALAPLA
jgi:membrane-bound serine protease (ClpP class)